MKDFFYGPYFSAIMLAVHITLALSGAGTIWIIGAVCWGFFVGWDLREALEEPRN